MPTRTITERAAERGVSLDQLAEVLAPAASEHFGPLVTIEASVNADQTLVELYAAFRITEEKGPGAISQASAMAHLKHEVELNDELIFQIFYSPEHEEEAESQDSYVELIGVSSVCSGFWPVARHALAPLLGFVDDPLEDVVQRALFFSIATQAQRDGNFALRRGKGSSLFLKERIVVGQGEIAAGHFGRRDLVAGVSVEVIRREVPVIAVISGLFGSDAVDRAREGTAVTKEQLVAALASREVHLSRRSAFRTKIDRLVAGEKRGALDQFAQLVASERDARFIP